MVATLDRSAAFLIENNRRILIVVLILLVASGVVYSLYLGDNLRFLPDERDYFALAKNIATRGAYTLDGEHPTAFRPPGYPLFLSVFYSIGARLVHFRILNFVILGLSIYVVYKILQEISSSFSAIVGALLVVFYPVAFFTAGTLYPQTLASLLLLLFFYWMISKENHSYYLVLAGLSLGYLVLTVPIFVFILPVMLVWYWCYKDTLSVKGTGLLVVVLSAILVLGSWTARNYFAFGSWVFVSSNSGENLLLGNSENTTPNGGSGVDISKYLSPAAHLDEIERDKFLRGQALKYIWEHKLQTVKMYFLKLLNFFNFRNELVTQSEGSSLQDILMLVTYAPLLLILSLRLLMLSVYKPVPSEVLLILIYLGSAFTNALFFTRIRFRIPSDFLLIVIAALFVEKVLSRQLKRMSFVNV